MQETQPSKERSITYQILFREETRKKVFTYIQAKNNPAIRGNVARSVKGTVDLGVPFVTASGNHDESRVVDKLPQVLDDDDIPLIVVGAGW